MIQTKSVFQSRTIWSNIAGLAAVILSTVGQKIGVLPENSPGESALTLFSGGSLIASTIFRLMADKKLV